MSDDDLKPFSIDRAKQGRAKCKKCKNPCEVNNFITFVNKKNQKNKLISERRVAYS